MFDFLSNKFSSIFSRLTGQSHLSEKNINETLQKINDALLEADVPYEVIQTFLQEVSDEVMGQKVLSSLKPGEQFIKVVHDKLVSFLGGEAKIDFSFQIPSIVMVMGLQGSGKTTTLSKLAYYVINQAKKRNKDRKVLLASVDFYRPAAIDQLEVLAHQVGVSFYKAQSDDPVKAVQEIVKHFKDNSFDLLFLDTAGRLHIDERMLQELQKIDATIKPKYKILVLDAMTGQESLNVAKAFEQGVGFDSALLAKMDSDARGGAGFAFRYALNKPIVFVGTGEKIADLELFKPERIATRILGMGDIQTLLERTEEKIKKVDQEAMHKSLMQGKMTLQDFAKQLEMVSKIGSLGQITKLLPGMGTLSPEKVQQGEAEMKRFKAIINSMTKKERLQPKILNGSRKQRIAKGAGVTASDVNTLLQKFEQSQQFVKLFKKVGRFGGFGK